MLMYYGDATRTGGHLGELERLVMRIARARSGECRLGSPLPVPDPLTAMFTAYRHPSIPVTHIASWQWVALTQNDLPHPIVAIKNGNLGMVSVGKKLRLESEHSWQWLDSGVLYACALPTTLTVTEQLDERFPDMQGLVPTDETWLFLVHLV